MKSLITLSVLALLLIVGSSILTAQEKTSNLKDFKIVIEKNNNEIIMTCEEGCAWLDLTYENRKQAQAIDEFGMTELNTLQSKKENNFLITLTKTKDGVSLKGIKGTLWSDLSFSLLNGQKQRIDQNGMIDKK